MEEEKQTNRKSTMSTPLKEGRPASPMCPYLWNYFCWSKEEEEDEKKKPVAVLCSNRLCTANGQLNRIAPPRENLTDDEEEEERNLCRFFHRQTHTHLIIVILYQRWLRCYLSDCVSLDRNKKESSSLLSCNWEYKKEKGNRLLLLLYYFPLGCL